jgi:hypothetical protein
MSTTTGTHQTLTATLPSLTWTWTKVSTTGWEVIGWHIGTVILHRVVTEWPASTTSGRATRHLNDTSPPICGIGGGTMPSSIRSDPVKPSAEGDLLAARALDVASAGIVVGPVVLHLYSLALLIRLMVSRLPLGVKGRSQAREAWMLDLLFLFSAALCLVILWAAYLRG